MNYKKEELNAGISLSLYVQEGRGLLEYGQPVIIIDNHTVSDQISLSFGLISFGYVLVPNKEDGGKATIFFRARAVRPLTSNQAFSAGALLSYKDNNTKVSKANIKRATATITIIDSDWDGGETITIDDFILTEGIDFSAGTSREATARALTQEINQRIPTVRATVHGSEITLNSLELGQSNISLATSDDGSDVTVSDSTLVGGDVSALFAYGVALESASGPDEQINALIF